MAIHSIAIVDDGAQTGATTHVWHWVHISSGTIIGEACSLGRNIYVGNRVKTSNRVNIQNDMSVYDNVTLEDDAFRGPNIVLTNAYDPHAAIECKSEHHNTLICQGATLDANYTIMCGTMVGRYAFVGADAIVNKDVPDFALVAGIPARQIAWMDQHDEQLDLPHSGNAQTICTHIGERYLLKTAFAKKCEHHAIH